MENLMKEDAISELKDKNLDLTRDALEVKKNNKF